MAIDDDIAGVIVRAKKGIEVNDETLALDVIKAVGFGGNYLSTSHTMRNFRREIRFSDLLNRVNRESWRAQGSRSMEERARSRVDGMLSAKRRGRLTNGQRAELRGIERKWATRLVN
jgi:trimethylamine--corrinoid protein Co-methyltransferase